MAQLRLKPGDGSSDGTAHRRDLAAVLLGHSGVRVVDISERQIVMVDYDERLVSEGALKDLVSGAGYGDWHVEQGTV